MRLGQIGGGSIAATSRNITFSGVRPRKSIEEFVRDADAQQALQRCQLMLSSLQGTSSDGEFNALLKLTELRLAELKNTRNPIIVLAARVLN